MNIHWKKYGFILITSLAMLASSYPSYADEDEWVYEVISGDNLWNLAEKYLINTSFVPRIQLLNRISDPLHLEPGSQIHIPTRWLATSSTVAKVLNLQGKAELIEHDTGKVSELHLDSLVMEGDSVRTGSNSSLELKFVDGSTLTLMENSQLTLKNMVVFSNTEMTNTQLDLQEGRLETKVAPKTGSASQYKISTPSSVTSVRGTNYRVSAEPISRISRTEVLQGGVAVSNQGKTREIPKGYGTLTSPNQAPIAPVELLAAPDVSAVPKVLEQLPIHFSLPSLSEQHSYRVQVSSTADFSHIVFDQKSQTSDIRGRDLDDASYFLRVRRIDEHGIEGLNVDMPITVNAKPEPPFLLEPKPDAGVTEERPVFQWASQKNISNYHVQIARDKAFKQIVLEQRQLDDVKFTADKDILLGNYYWRVASVDEKNTDGPFSDAQAFKRIAQPPVLDEPDVSDESIVIRTRSSAVPGQKYLFQMAKDEEFKELLVNQEAAEPQLKVNAQPPGTYYIRVKSIDRDGFVGPFGQVQMLDISDNGIYRWLLLLPLLALIAI
jgi:hypothetical protein